MTKENVANEASKEVVGDASTSTDWSKYKEEEPPKPGETRKATVVETGITTWRDIIPSEKLEKFDNPDQKVCQVICSTEDGKTITKNIAMPNGMTIATNSNLGKYKKRYGNYPKPNDEVTVMADANGFFELVL